MNSEKATLPLIFLFPLLVVLLLLSALHAPINAAPDGTITVNTLADDESDGCGTNNCTLREAITDAVAGDVINFSTSGTIDISGNGQLLISKDLTINGGNIITVSGNSSTRIFRVISGNVIFDGLTIANGADQNTECFGSSCGGGILVQNSDVTVTITDSVFVNNVADFAGGIFNYGTVSIISSTCSNNSADNGGCIYNMNIATVSNSILLDNSAVNYGGAVFNYGTGMLTINNSTLSENSTLYGGGGIYSYGVVTIDNSILSGNSTTSGSGGGVFNDNMMTIISSTLMDNSATNRGGGIYNNSTVTVSNSLIYNNLANDIGGGIFNYGTGTVTVNTSTVFGNLADDGGGVYNFGTLTIDSSTLSENLTNNDGGGMYNAGGTVTVNNSTFSGNLANRGGGIFNYYGVMTTSEVFINNCTITENRVGTIAGGIGNYGNAGSRTTITNSIVSGNVISVTSVPDDVTLYTGSTDTFISGGHNLIGTIGAGIVAFIDGVNGDQTDINVPDLASLANNGGNTFTHALQLGSPAIDAGDDISCLATDQRGVSRVGTCDIGAYEYDNMVFTEFVFLPVVIK